MNIRVRLFSIFVQKIKFILKMLKVELTFIKVFVSPKLNFISFQQLSHLQMIFFHIKIFIFKPFTARKGIACNKKFRST